MRMRQGVVTLLVLVFLLGRPAGVDAGWAGMLVQVAAVLSQIRSYVTTAEMYVNQARAEVQGLLDPGGIVSGIRSLADWRRPLSELTDTGPLWEPFRESRALVEDAVINYQQASDLGSYDFGSVTGVLEFLDSRPLGWSAGKESVWQILVDDVGLPGDLRDEIRWSEQLRQRVANLRYSATMEARFAAAAVLGDHVAGEYSGRSILEDTVQVLDGTRRFLGGPSDPDPALSHAEAAGVATQLASLQAHQSAGALALRAAEMSAEARDVRLEAHRAALDARRVLNRLADIASAVPPDITDDVGDDPLGPLGTGDFMAAWVN